MTQAAPAAPVSEAAVVDALRAVNDPELDASLVELGFLDGVAIDGDRVDVSLRLPTFWCAPNFAFLMAHDAREHVLRVPGVRQARVTLKDNAYSDEISAGVSAGRPFAEVFPDQADGDDLAELRALFGRKAFGMRQEQLVRFLQEAGLGAADIVALRVGDVLDCSDATGLRLRLHGAERLLRGGAPLARLYLDRRARLGLPGWPAAPLITDADGQPVGDGELPAYLQQCRRQRISITFNTVMCRGLLETRYGLNTRRVDEGCTAV